MPLQSQHELFFKPGDAHSKQGQSTGVADFLLEEVRGAAVQTLAAVDKSLGLFHINPMSESLSKQFNSAQQMKLNGREWIAFGPPEASASAADAKLFGGNT
jgi:hypothetical protein